jgi:uncharacterized membrane protein YhfC
MEITKIIITIGILCLIIGGLMIAFINKDYKLGLASVLIGIANFCLMVLR